MMVAMLSLVLKGNNELASLPRGRFSSWDGSEFDSPSLFFNLQLNAAAGVYRRCCLSLFKNYLQLENTSLLSLYVIVNLWIAAS